MELDPETFLVGKPFTSGEARHRGLTPDQLRNKNAFASVSYGIYRPAAWDFDLADAARALCAASPGAWVSHGTAARLHGLILPPWLSDSNELHVSKPRRLPGPRRKGIVGHTVTTFLDEIEVVDGIRLSTRARTWLDLARTLPVTDLICMGDQLIRIPRPTFEGRSCPYATLDSLWRMVKRHGNLQGIVRARAALEQMRVGADSAPETQLRLAMLDAGLPEPELQLTLWPGGSAPSADAGYRDRKIAVQYDGAHHLDMEQKRKDKVRDQAFRGAGWTVLIFDQSDCADGFKNAVQRIKDALSSAWVDPAILSGFTPRLVSERSPNHPDW